MSTLTIELTVHAVERFHERVRPGLSRAAAEEELAFLLALATVTCEPPAWVRERAVRRADCHAVMGDVVLPLYACGGVLVATTCIARGGLSARARQRRNARRAARTWAAVR